MKEKMSLWSGIFSAGIILAFGVYLMVHNIPQNIASWLMWTIIDTVVLASSIAAGNKRPYLAIGWVTSAALVTSTLFFRGGWTWGFVESLSLGVVALTLIIWALLGPKAGVIASTLALTVAGIPAMHDALQHPEPASWWLWGGVALSCIGTIYGAKSWKVEERFLPSASFVYNFTMMILVLQ